jgi:hypothetical protein
MTTLVTRLPQGPLAYLVALIVPSIPRYTSPYTEGLTADDTECLQTGLDFTPGVRLTQLTLAGNPLPTPRPPTERYCG